jgi:hypothetical protein
MGMLNWRDVERGRGLFQALFGHLPEGTMKIKGKTPLLKQLL